MSTSPAKAVAAPPVVNRSKNPGLPYRQPVPIKGAGVGSVASTIGVVTNRGVLPHVNSQPAVTKSAPPIFTKFGYSY